MSRTLFDQVTGLPQRPEFQAELEAALAEAVDRKLPAVLILLGPDNFGWVNERLDRRSGDLVLGEIATALRASLRSRDHVARYGGATFAVILFDTARDVGRTVTENLVRRLDEQRYHGGILRLEFGAGLAVTDGTEALDAQEMIRRADQALSAARRDDAGRVRIWEKGSDVESAGSIDRLQGIFTGDKTKDYRNMRLLLDSVAVVASSADPAELALRFTARLFETLQARRVAVVEKSRAGAFEVLGGFERTPGGARRFELTARDLRDPGAQLPGAALRGRASATPRTRRCTRCRSSCRTAGWAASFSRCRPPSTTPTGASSTPSPRGWRWPSTARACSSASASGSGRRRSGWRPRSPTSGGWCTGRGSPTARRPWSPCWPRRARSRAPTPPCSSPARAAPARRCSRTPSTS